MKVYLGDGVYAELVTGPMIRLTAEDGIMTTNTIYLEPEVVSALFAYIEQIQRAAGLLTEDA